MHDQVFEVVDSSGQIARSNLDILLDSSDIIAVLRYNDARARSILIRNLHAVILTAFGSTQELYRRRVRSPDEILSQVYPMAEVPRHTRALIWPPVPMVTLNPNLSNRHGDNLRFTPQVPSNLTSERCISTIEADHDPTPIAQECHHLADVIRAHTWRLLHQNCAVRIGP